jgi:CheY-like chemotaxis protein
VFNFFNRFSPFFAHKPHNDPSLYKKCIFVERYFIPRLLIMKSLFILIAEDDSDDRFLMQKALEETGKDIKIEFVENGVELLDSLNKTRTADNGNYPGFILLDLNMPKMDGREVLKTIKTDDEFKKIPVVIFSTTKNQLEVKRCYDLGANTYIVKPVNFDLLVETIHDIHKYWLKTATLVDA